jgi:hypothetical protein
MRISIFISCLFISIAAKAQLAPVGKWRLHVNYSEAISVAEAGSKIFCASKSAVYCYDKADNSLTTLTKISGLSDVDINSIKYNNVSHSIIVAYNNTNVDIIDGKSVTNISDIKRKSILGNKVINNIYCNGKYAYLACGFGIVVIDMVRKEVSDTYYIGSNGDVIQVFDITADSTYLYAATENGLQKATKNSEAIANYSSWSKDPNLPKGIYNSVDYYKNKLYVNRSRFIETGIDNSDTLFVSNGHGWSRFDSSFAYTINSVKSYYGKLVISTSKKGLVYDSTLIKTVENYAFFVFTQQVIIDKENTYWIADRISGLCSLKDNDKYSYLPNGPFRGTTYAMAVQDDNLWVAPGGHTPSWSSVYIKSGVSSFIDNKWVTYNGFNSVIIDSMYDIMSIAIDPKNKNHLYMGSWGRGLVEFTNGIPAKIYNDLNSPLKHLSNQPNYYWVGVGGLAFDGNSNLWMTNNSSTNPLLVKKPDGTWKVFDLGGILNGYISSSILIDDYNQKWIMSPIGGGIVVFSEGADIDNTSDDRYRKLAVHLNFNGSNNNVNMQCMAKDLDGAIWIGTDIGIGVYYSPGNILDAANDGAAQQILIQQDGYNQYLLSSETVTAIAIDGANRKWVGTQKGGVFLLSADGTKQIYNFTEDNSPLLSNSVTSIVINDNTGEVFIGSEKGISSFRGTATKGNDKYKDVYAFPNPVPTAYTGTIAIKGLIEKSNIKITNISGGVVYETKSEGGQAVWDGNNLYGERVESGVYLVFCTTTDGAETEVTKLLFIK